MSPLSKVTLSFQLSLGSNIVDPFMASYVEHFVTEKELVCNAIPVSFSKYSKLMALILNVKKNKKKTNKHGIYVEGIIAYLESQPCE